MKPLMRLGVTLHFLAGPEFESGARHRAFVEVKLPSVGFLQARTAV